MTGLSCMWTLTAAAGLELAGEMSKPIPKGNDGLVSRKEPKVSSHLCHILMTRTL